MSNEQILKIGRVTTDLSIEVGTAITQTTVADDFHHSLCQLEVVDGELVGIPSILSITTVSVNRTQHTCVNSTSQLMLEGMTSQCGVVHLDVHLEVLIQAMCLQETDNGLSVNIILVLRRLHGLRLNKECALESLAACIVASHAKHHGHVLLLSLLVGVQQAHVTLTTTPEHIVGTTELNGSIDRILNLNDSTSYDVEVRVGRSTVGITLVTKDISGTPKQFDVGELLHLLLSIVGDGLHALFILSDGGSLLNEVYIVEAEVLNTQLIHDLEASVHLILGPLNRAFSLVPLV